MKDSKKSKKRRHSAEETEPPKLKVSLESSISSVATAGCSWGSAFSAAAQIQPAEGIEDTFFSQQVVDAGLAKISQIAAASAAATNHANLKKKDASDIGAEEKATKTLRMGEKADSIKHYKRKRSSSEVEDEANSTVPTPPVSMEGRMVAHPHSSGEQLMVLVDSKRNIVYSAIDRTPTGDYLRIGKLGDSGDISLDDNAFASQEQGKHAPKPLLSCMYRSRHFFTITMACVGQISC